MDPLSAISLAGNVVQFVTFTLDLISTTKELYRSSKGCTSESLALETVYGQLRDFSTELALPSQVDPDVPPEIAKQLSTISSLSRSCKSDCDKLLEVIETIKVQDGTWERWKSFKAALKVAWKKPQIASLEERLHQTQCTLTLQICALTSHWHKVHENRLTLLQEESKALRAEQSATLDEIAKTLVDLQEHMQPPATNPASNALDEEVAYLQSRMSQLQLTETKIEGQQQVLKHLSFESRQARHTIISDAHKSTFQWALEDQKRANTPNSLVKWLKEEGGYFWVSGKPGSGKSTFMKYLAESKKTKQLLSVWSQPQPIVIACHYFWSPGTKMQKSQQGLLQTLLYEIFRQCPDLIESCYKRQLAVSTKTKGFQEPWPIPELHQILQHIANADDIGVKFCMFIDGLDEYEGDHLEFCSALHDLAKSAHIKLCISSRPWNAFTDAFGQDSNHRLYMHELTRGDIQRYTTNRLQTHPRWQELLIDTPSADTLIQEIVQRATGVFLWVVLVTKLLRDGLTEYDSYLDLHKRLDTFPTDLQAFFRHILGGVEVFHQEKMAASLRIALAATSPLDLMVYTFHDEEYEDPHYVLKLPLCQSDDRALSRKSELTNRRLIGRCRGLLEVNKVGEVNFLHRTVMDFLRLAEMSNFLIEKSPPSFNPYICLLRAYTAWFKTTKFSRIPRRKLEPCDLKPRFREATVYAALAAVDGHRYEQLSHQLLDDLDCSAMYADSQNVFREQVIRAQLVIYLTNTLSRSAHYFSTFEPPPLFFCTSPDYSHDLLSSTTREGEEIWSKQTVEVIRCLLEHGQNPNKGYMGEYYKTPWIEVVKRTIPGSNSVSSNNEQASTFRSALETGLFKVFLQYGADRNARVTFRTSRQEIMYSSPWINYLFAFLDIPNDPVFESLYLQGLDDFLSGIDIDCPQQQQGGGRLPEDVFPLLFGQLEPNSGQERPRNSRLLTEIIDRLLSRSPKSQSSKDIWLSIEKFLPGHSFERLKAKYKLKRPATKTSKEATKRRRPTNTLSPEVSPKRRK